MHAGRINTSIFGSGAFVQDGGWLGNPDAVLQGIQTAGGDPATNGTQGTVVLHLTNPQCAP